MIIKTDMFRLIVTESCNAKCKYCLASLTPKPGQNQSLKAVEQAARKAKENGAKEATISGGEPLLDKDIINKIKIVKKYFKKVNLQTNGTLMANPKGLKRAGITHVIVNLPSYEKKVYELLTGVKKFGKLMSNMKKALKAGLKVRINSVLVKNYTGDYAHCMKMIEFSKQLGVKELTFTQLVPANEFARQHRTDLDVTRELFKKLTQTENKRYHSADVYNFLDMTIALSSCPIKENSQALENGWTKEYVLTEDSKLVADYFHQDKTLMEVLR